MAGSFLDTTVVVDLADRLQPGRDKAEKHIAANGPAQSPYYALRELLAGHVQYICQAHNVLLAAETAPEALLALLKRSPAEGRKREARIQILAEGLRQIFEVNPTGDRQRLKRELLQHLALRVTSLWRRAHHLDAVTLTQSLSCFNDGKIVYGSSGELKGPKDSFNCVKSERCAAAAYLYDRKDEVQKMIAALHPDSLGQAAAKNENRQRRKALKELLARGPAAFSKGKCRALGDAYFAAMSPPGYSVLTTNVQDHIPLCVALAKTAVAP